MSARSAEPARVRARYLHSDGAPGVFALLHEPTGATVRQKAVLFCPPFGWEDTCSYRRRREWAQALADDGYAALRIDLPSTGDSVGSPYDAGRVRAWRAAICASVEWLLATTGASAATGVGVGLGGLLLCDAVGAGARIDELVLWGAPSRGAAFVRELRAFARLEAMKTIPSDVDGRGERGRVGTSAGGFALAKETMEDLGALDATSIALPAGRPRRALLFARDGIPVDEPLREHLLASGAAVDVLPGDGYSETMAPPHQGRTPFEVIEASRAWLADDAEASAPAAGAPGATGGRRRMVRESYAIELVRGQAIVRESPLRISQPFGHLFGVLSQPVAAPTANVTAILLNAGAHRRIGQGRMWVEAARRWAAAGVPTLRLDLEGIGDSDGDGRRFTDMGELYDERLVAQALAALDALDARGFGPRYVAAGLCSGACWSFHMALRDERVRAALMINPQAIFWHRSLSTARMIRHGSKLKLLRGEVELARLVRFARGLPALAAERARARVRTVRSGNELERALDTLRDTGKRVEFMFSGSEPLRAELEAQGWPETASRWPNVSFTVIPGEDHILRPLPAQRFVHGELDAAVEAELGHALARGASDAGADPSGPAGSPDGFEEATGEAFEAAVLQVVRMMSTEQGA